MVLIDTNILLRYILNDHAEQSAKAMNIILDNDVLILTQVVAEAIYVLKDVYSSTRTEIVDDLLSVSEIGNVHFENSEIVFCALREFKKTKLVFVDLLLFSYQKYTGDEVATFDTKLIAKLKRLQGN